MGKHKRQVCLVCSGRSRRRETNVFILDQLRNQSNWELDWRASDRLCWRQSLIFEILSFQKQQKIHKYREMMKRNSVFFRILHMACHRTYCAILPIKLQQRLKEPLTTAIYIILKLYAEQLFTDDSILVLIYLVHYGSQKPEIQSRKGVSSFFCITACQSPFRYHKRVF